MGTRKGYHNTSPVGLWSDDGKAVFDDGEDVDDNGRLVAEDSLLGGTAVGMLAGTAVGMLAERRGRTATDDDKDC